MEEEVRAGGRRMQDCKLLAGGQQPGLGWSTWVGSSRLAVGRSDGNTAGLSAESEGKVEKVRKGNKVVIHFDDQEPGNNTPLISSQMKSKQRVFYASVQPVTLRACQ